MSLHPCGRGRGGGGGTGMRGGELRGRSGALLGCRGWGSRRRETLAWEEGVRGDAGGGGLGWGGGFS